MPPSIENIGSEKLPPDIQNNQRMQKPSIVPNVPNLGSQQSNNQIQAYPYEAGPRKSENRKKKDPFGYRISVLALRNYSLKKAIKVKLIIYE